MSWRRLEGAGEDLDLGAGRGQHGLLCLAAFQAGELFVFEALDLALGKSDFVVAGLGLRGSGDGVALGTNVVGLFAVDADFAFHAGAQRFFAVERIAAGSSVALRRCESGGSLGDLSRQCTSLLHEPRPFKLQGLQFHQVFNVRFHPWNEVYHP